MFIDALYERVGALSPLAETFGDIAMGNDAHLKVVSSARPLVVALEFARSPKPTLVVVPGADGAKSFARTLEEFVGSDKVILYPDISPDIFSDQYIPVDIACTHARAQYCLTKSEQVIVVASGASVASKILPPNYAAYAPLVVKQDVQPIDAATGEMLTFENFIHALALRGYENTATPDGGGTFGIHGGIIDIQLPGVSYIVRLDFFGDEVDSIRRVIPGTFQEISSLQMCEIFPVRPYKVTKKNFKQAAFALATLAKTNPAYRNLYDKASTHIDFAEARLLMPFITSEEKDPEKALVSLGDYMPKDALVILSEPRSIIDDVGHFYQDVESYAAVAKMNVDPYLQKPMQLNFGKSPRLMLSSISQVGEKQTLDLPIKRPDIAGSIERLFDRLHMFMEQKMMVVLSIPHYRAREDIEMQLVHEGFSIKNHCDTAGEGFDAVDEAALTPGVVHIIDHELEQGMVIPKLHCALISIHDLQGQARRVRKRKRVDITETTFPYKPGDYVVHAFHGVALFQGIVEQKTDAGIRDYLQLDYAGGDKLYVPVDRLDRVMRYVGSGEGKPRLTRLNSTDWSRAVARATKATKKLAFDLLDIYSRRSAIKGYAFSSDTVWQKEMEDSFSYIETPDQLQAIEDVKADMQSSKPMDRLICGDVGFGKTEVALRAAFKAAGDGKQVMVLCPTTILAQQHFNTFHDRFDQFDVRVEVLSRFKTATEQRKIIDDFSQGDVAVLVGTHRLLSRDIIPKDLGLVIIDEEQRFGVGHKEQLKNLREHIDVLTLSATPIPRTMQMSLSGVRDMSLILTPPTDRRPVEVHVGEWDIDIVSDAIRNEVQRGGQVYYVSNRVRTLDDAYERVHTAVPEARIGFAHGKLDKKSLEQVMEDFSAGKFDVLVATTIIESGIDNPHTNTLIIEDAHRLGLAQMYQLKGRVGRSVVQAYAYFMFPENIELTQDAIARLEAINEHRDLGSGMRVALKDLEIRGAGSLIGAEQSGNMSAVGFDLFAQMLHSAVVAARQGVKTDDGVGPALSDIVVNIAGSAFFSDEYIPDVDNRVAAYRCLSHAESLEAVDDIEQELENSYGEMPQEAKNMCARARIRAWANEHDVRSVYVHTSKLMIEPFLLTSAQVQQLRPLRILYNKSARRIQIPIDTKALDGQSLMEYVANLLIQTWPVEPYIVQAGY